MGGVLCLQKGAGGEDGVSAAPCALLMAECPLPPLPLDSIQPALSSPDQGAELGQAADDSVFRPVCPGASPRLMLGCKDGLSTSLILAHPQDRYRMRQTGKISAIKHSEWIVPSTGSCGWGCWPKLVSAWKVSCGGCCSHTGQVKVMLRECWLTVGGYVLGAHRGSYQEA